MAHHRCEFYHGETHDFTKWQIFSASNGLHVAYDLTRGTFVPSSAIRSAKSTVLQAQEVPQCGSFGPPRGGNQPLLHWTNMSFAAGKQRFVCVLVFGRLFGHIRLPLGSIIEDVGHTRREFEHKCKQQDRPFAIMLEKRG